MEKVTELKPRSTLERIENAEKTNLELTSKLDYVLSILNDFNQKIMANEQACAALGKALSATTEELLNNKVIDSLKIMDNIRKYDDKAERERVQSLLKQGFLKQVDTVGPSSLVAITQKDSMTKKTGETIDNIITGYRVVEMSASHVAQNVRDMLTGKQTGETFEIDRKEHEDFTAVLSATVLEIYDFAEVQKEGEPA